MNLTRIRATSFINMIEYYSIHYGSELQFGDQDLLNIYFHFHSGMFLSYLTSIAIKFTHMVYLFDELC